MATPDLDSTASAELTAAAGDLSLCYQTFGAPDAAPLLLVMGLSSQMLLWDEDFCETLAGRGFRVIRFDNRDVGRSTVLHDAPIPSQWQLLMRDPRAAAYSLDEMAADAVGLLDHLDVDRAHVVGASMGGMIAQLMAINHPERVRSLVSIMSTTGARRVGRPHPRIAMRLLRRPSRDRAGFIEDHLETYRQIGSRGFAFEEDRKRERAGRCFDRGIHPAGGARQLAAVVTAPDRTARLRAVRTPTTVIHGDADPLVHVSGGRATAAAVPGSRLVILPGMGHDLPRERWPQILDAVAETAAAADA